MPEFSIILPTHNRAPLLCRAIASVILQSFADYELIVIDDASSDGTPATVSAFADPRLRCIRLERASGVSAARNAGIRAARGEFVAFLDDDDEYHTDFLARMASALHDAPPEVGFAWCGVRRVRATRSGLVTVREQRWQSNAVGDPFRHLRVGTGFGLTVRKACFDEVGLFDTDMPAAVDTDLMFRLGSRYNCVVVPEILITVYLHGAGQLTDRNARRAYAMDRLIENNIGVISQHDDLWVRYHRNAAALHYETGNRARARTMLIRALRRRPCRWRTWKSWLYCELFGHEDIGMRRLLVRSTCSSPDCCGSVGPP